MKHIFFEPVLVLVAMLATDAYAQGPGGCRHGGGMSLGVGGSLAGGSFGGGGYQAMMQQAYAQQQVQAYLTQQAEIAQEKAEKKERKVAMLKQRRETEMAKTSAKSSSRAPSASLSSR